MTVIINNVTYRNVMWENHGFTIATDMTLSDVEQTFAPSAETVIDVFDGETEVGRYYNRGIKSITVSGASPRKVTILFDITQLDSNAETEIRDGMEITDVAISELAELVGEMYELDTDERLHALESWQSDMMTDYLGVIPGIIRRIEALENGGGGNE